ncbi:hypothetical protein [Longimicrobium sp.]|jgi:hypothetical protein|uniref:hypothetical protein n=1 Tax=Longimicrobium sp. TaxID=2029185 RepID=UPI002EDB3C37
MVRLTASAKKGAILRALSVAWQLFQEKNAAHISSTAAVLAERSRQAVARLLPEVPNGYTVAVQITVDQDPLGDWSVAILLNTSRPEDTRR